MDNQLLLSVQSTAFSGESKRTFCLPTQLFLQCQKRWKEHFCGWGRGEGIFVDLNEAVGHKKPFNEDSTIL